jgi:[CysO sulfur-carrier protein]-S-L-cysteine hydrolase
LSRPDHLLLPREIYMAILEHAKSELPNECCGMLAGVREGNVLSVKACHKLVNEAKSPTEYFAAECLFQVHRTMRESGHHEIAIYHSHPKSPAIPSKKDLERNAYGDSVVHFIISLNGAEPELRGWWLTEDAYEEARWTVIDSWLARFFRFVLRLFGISRSR